MKKKKKTSDKEAEIMIGAFAMTAFGMKEGFELYKTISTKGVKKEDGR